MSRWFESGWSGRHPELRTPPAVVAVVVVRRDVRAVGVAEHANEPARDRGLAGAGVADHAEHDCAWH
jgi:hypothetical protein